MRRLTKVVSMVALSAATTLVMSDPADAQYDDGRRSARNAGNNQRLDPDETLEGRPERGAFGPRYDRQTTRRRAADASGRWVRVGVDYNNDGRIDAVETVYRDDFERARYNSRRRQSMDRQRAASQQNRNVRRDSLMTVRGQLQSVQETRFAGYEEPRLVARVRQQDGRTAKVLLGPKSQVNLDAESAGEVVVRGRPGRVNDRPMLIAYTMEANGRMLELRNQADRRLKRVRGQIISQRTTRFRGHDDPFIVAQVRLQGGGSPAVNLGPAPKIRAMGLREGTEVALLVRPGRINGGPALIAEQIQANDQVVEIPRPQAPALTRSQRESREQRAYRGREGREPQSRRDAQPQSRRIPQPPEDDSVTYEGRERAALGIMLSESRDGLQVVRVLPNSPAARAGLQEGDRIESVDGQATRGYRDLTRALGQRSPNERTQIRYRRNGAAQTADVQLDVRSEVFSDQQ